MQIKDRIKELRRVKASELIPNPKNWRTHPVAQQDALRGVLAEVGYADALIARETPEGLMLVDGHLRAETTPDSEVPVLVLDINEAEADLVLATLDPLAAMARADEERLKALLDDVTIESKGLEEMLESLLVNQRALMPDWSAMESPSQDEIDQRTEELQNQFANAEPAKMVDLTCPECGIDFQIRRSDLDNEYGRDS